MFETIDSTFIILYGMMTGQYYTEEFESSSLLMALNVLYMFLMAIIMLNILIAIVSDSYDAAMIRARALFTRAKFEFAAEQVAMRDALGWGFGSDGGASKVSTSLLHVDLNDDENQTETEWMGRALDMEHRVKKVVDRSKEEIKADVDVLRSDMESRVEKIVANSKHELKSEVDALRSDVSTLHTDVGQIRSDIQIMLDMMRTMVDSNAGRGGETS
jgi:hypothetical protein